MDKDLLLRDEAQSGSERPSSQCGERGHSSHSKKGEETTVREGKLALHMHWGIHVGRKSFRTK